MKFYRIAHKDKIFQKRKWNGTMLGGWNAGPYVSYEDGPGRPEGMQRAHSGADHPSPGEDGMEHHYWNDAICGFYRKWGIRSWFKGFLRELHKLGYCVYVYDAKDMHRGDKSGCQAVARFKDLTLVEKMSIPTWCRREAA